MTFDDQTTGLLLVVALGLGGVLALVVGFLAFRLSRLRRDYRAAVGDHAGDVFATLAEQDEALEAVRRDLRTVHGNTELLRDLLRSTMCRTAIVRYDAFEDMGGAMSFSLALLDEHATGVVITSINGRAETRTYAKPITEGESDYSLSEDERRVIEQARRNVPQVGADPEGRRKRRKVAS